MWNQCVIQLYNVYRYVFGIQFCLASCGCVFLLVILLGRAMRQKPSNRLFSAMAFADLAFLLMMYVVNLHLFSFRLILPRDYAKQIIAIYRVNVGRHFLAWSNWCSTASSW